MIITRRILAGPIQFHEAPDDKGGGADDAPFSLPDVANNMTSEQDIPFDEFFKKKQDEPESKKDDETPPEGEKSTETPPEGEKHAGEAPDAAAEALKQQEEAEKQAAAAKQQADDKAAVTEEEIEAITIKETASTSTKDQFKNLKEITKAKAKLAKELEAKVKDLEAKTTGIPEDVQAKLKDMEKRLKLHEAEANPELQAEFAEKATAAETKLFDLLCDHPKLKLPRTTPEGSDTISAETIQKAGMDSDEGRALLHKILKHVDDSVDDPFLADDIRESIRARAKVTKEKKEAVELLRTDANKFQQQRALKEQERGREWGQLADNEIREILQQPEAEWANLLEAKPNATPEQKAHIEKHNAHLREHVVPKVQAGLKTIYAKDPVEGMRLVFKAVERDHFEVKLKAAQAEASKLKAEVERLTRLAKGVQRVSDPQDTRPTPETKKESSDQFAEVGSAMDQFFLKKQ